MKKVIGIDLGGSKISGAIVDEKGDLGEIKSIGSRGQEGRDTVLFRIRQLIDSLLTDEVMAIGIGSPGFIDVNKGRVLSVVGNINNWGNTELVEEIGRFYSLPVVIGNDCNLAALCESWLGAGKDLDNFVMITIGTGLGGAIYSKDRGLWLGERYEGGEFGHMIMYPGGRACNCGQTGCVDKYVSGTGIENNYFDLTNNRMSAEDIFKNLDRDPSAKKSMDRFIDDLVILLINIKNALDPKSLIIGGGVVNSREYWLDKLRDGFKKTCNSGDGMDILVADYLNDSGIIGAGKIALDFIREDRKVVE